MFSSFARASNCMTLSSGVRSNIIATSDIALSISSIVPVFAISSLVLFSVIQCYSGVIRVLFGCYSVFFVCYSGVIRLLFGCYSGVIQCYLGVIQCYSGVIQCYSVLFGCYSGVIRVLFSVIRVLFSVIQCYSGVIQC
jgi:hypothetical protein